MNAPSCGSRAFPEPSVGSSPELLTGLRSDDQRRADLGMGAAEAFVRHSLVPYGWLVAWIRRVRMSSGATAVQISGSVDGRRRNIAHVGSAHTRLGLLVERARAAAAGSGTGPVRAGDRAVSGKDVAACPAGGGALFGDRVTTIGKRVTAAPRVISTAQSRSFSPASRHRGASICDALEPRLSSSNLQLPSPARQPRCHRSASWW